MRDVAAQARVSLKTVSRVVNDEPAVAQALVDRVLTAIAELGFRRNDIARNLRSGRVNATVRVVMVMAQLFGTVFGGLVGEALGLRTAALLAPAFALVGAVGLYLSPVWRVRD